MTAMQLNSAPQFWIDLRSMILDRSRWWDLRTLLGISQEDEDTLEKSRACTGVMPESVAAEYVITNIEPRHHFYSRQSEPIWQIAKCHISKM